MCQIKVERDDAILPAVEREGDVTGTDVKQSRIYLPSSLSFITILYIEFNAIMGPVGIHWQWVSKL